MMLVDPNDNATMKAKDLVKVIQDVVASNVQSMFNNGYVQMCNAIRCATHTFWYTHASIHGTFGASGGFDWWDVT
jgi:hypothetical protein